MNSILVLLVVIVAIFVLCLCNKESFWGGYLGTPYLAQMVPGFDRAGIDAATGGYRMFVNPEACPINPSCAYRAGCCNNIKPQ